MPNAYAKTYMDINKIQEYKQRLETERSILINELMKEETPEDFGDDTGNPDEETDEAESLGNKLSLGQVTRGRINEIDAALNRIVENKYGICEKCGGEIEDEVLALSPESRFCKNCKTK